MEQQLECLGDEGGLIFEDEISAAIEPIQTKIVAPILLAPVVTAELTQTESKTVADVKPAEVKSEIPAPIPEPQKPVTMCLDGPNAGDGVSGLAYRPQPGGVIATDIAVWVAQGHAQQEQLKHLQQGLR